MKIIVVTESRSESPAKRVVKVLRFWEDLHTKGKGQRTDILMEHQYLTDNIELTVNIFIINHYTSETLYLIWTRKDRRFVIMPSKEKRLSPTPLNISIADCFGF